MKKLLLGAALFLLPVTVFADSVTKDLRLGSKGAEVTILQTFLAEDATLYPEAIVTGYFGLKTQAAVKRFQKRESITPASGIVGPKTRARLNQLISGTADGSRTNITSLQAQLQALQRVLQVLISASSSQATSSVSQDTTPPRFISGPAVTFGTISTSSPFGAQAPIQVSIDWKTDEPSAPTGFGCNPLLAQSGFGLQALYYAGHAGPHQCVLQVKDAAGNKASASFSFAAPSWFSVSGSSTAAFYDAQKIGDVVIVNNATTSQIIYKVNINLDEALNDTNARGAKFNLYLRNGTTTYDTVLTKTEVTLAGRDPYPIGTFNSQIITMYAGLAVASGETKTLSLWYDALPGPRYAGSYMRLTVYSVLGLPDQASVGNATFSFLQ
ncbi:MAG: peptidoglycan-binding protein [Candidatus Sungbacteria bacterium]|uniref:Peptidoglycan-binding protein n=1 Tax=Candidatus Sungiibacteriota bacterium TaxID=2750080 RepID=A0A9D6QY88_9BACT|nr:peptidoglycan-binding protein [Candidatus Sungbacteria bacterium]